MDTRPDKLATSEIVAEVVDYIIINDGTIEEFNNDVDKFKKYI